MRKGRRTVPTSPFHPAHALVAKKHAQYTGNTPPPERKGGNGRATHTGIKATMNDVGKERRNNDAGRSDKTPPLAPERPKARAEKRIR